MREDGIGPQSKKLIECKFFFSSVNHIQQVNSVIFWLFELRKLKTWKYVKNWLIANGEIDDC